MCITLGSRGALLLDSDRLYTAPAFKVEAVDTTGAGDVFRGALIVAMLRGDRPDEMLRFANAAAGIRARGSGPSMASRHLRRPTRHALEGWQTLKRTVRDATP